MIHKNVDRLIDAINKYSDQLGATARYTTIDDYAEAVKPLREGQWETYEGDFFP